MLNIQTQPNAVNGSKWTEVTHGLLRSCCPSGWSGFSALSSNTRIFYSITSDIDCSNLLGRGHPPEFLQAQDVRDIFVGGFVATNYALKIVPPLECRGEPNPSLVTWTSSSLMVPTSRDVFTAYDSDTPIVRNLVVLWKGTHFLVLFLIYVYLRKANKCIISVQWINTYYSFYLGLSHNIFANYYQFQPLLLSSFINMLKNVILSMINTLSVH